MIYSSEKENYEKQYKKQEENCIQETKQREEKLFEMFYDFKYDIAPMLEAKKFEVLKDCHLFQDQKDQRKQNFDDFLDFYKEKEEKKLDSLIKSEEFKLLTDFEKKIFFLNPNIRELGLFIDYSNKKYCNTYKDFFYYLYFDFILNKIDDKYTDESHLTKRNPENLKRTQLFSYLPEVTNLQFKIEYLRYFYKILTELYEQTTPLSYSYYDSIESEKVIDNELLELIKQCVDEYKNNEENKLKRKNKLENFFKDNLELFQYLGRIDTVKNKLEKDFNDNLENSKDFLQKMLKPDINKPDFCEKKTFLLKTSLYNDNLEIPSLNKKELIEHIIHKNDELINEDLLSNVLETEKNLYKMYLDYSAFVFKSSCLYSKDDNNINVLEIINNKKKDLSNYCKKKFNEYNKIYKELSDKLQQYLQYLKKELEDQTKDIDNRYVDPEIDKNSQKLKIDRQTQKQNIKQFLDTGSLLDTSSLGIDQKTIYLQNPEVLKYQLQLQLDEIEKEYILKPSEFYENEINVITEEAEYLINFINFSDNDIEISDNDIEINEKNRKTKIADEIKSLLDEIENEYILKSSESYKNEINTIVEKAKDLINFINFSDKDKINEKIKSLKNDIVLLKTKLKNVNHNKIDNCKDNLNVSNENIELKDKIQSLHKKIDCLEKKPHYKTHTLKDNLKQLVKTYLVIKTDLIDDKNIIDTRIEAYKDYYERKKKEILDPYLKIISNLQIKYYNSVSDILKDIEKRNVVYKKNNNKSEYSFKYSFSTNSEDKDIDNCYERLQDYLRLNYPRKTEQNFEFSLDNIQRIGQFLANYKKKLKDNFESYILNTEQLIDFYDLENEIIKNFETMREPKNINNDHNIELKKILDKLKIESKDLNRNFEEKLKTSDYKDQKQKLDKLCKHIEENRDIFKANMEELINIVKNQHEEEKKIREFEIEIQKNKEYLNELNQIIESYSNLNNKEQKEKNNGINSLNKDEEIVKKRQETLNSLINSLNDETYNSLIEAKSKIKAKINDLETKLTVNKNEHSSLTEKYQKQQNLNILDKENFLNLEKNYIYIDAKSFFVEGEFDFISEGEFDFISWLDENFPNRRIIDNKYIDSQEKKQQPINIYTINYPYSQNTENFQTKINDTFFQNQDSSFYLVLNIHLNVQIKINYRVKFYE
ncbi:hypothetical protein [Candidatus Phytoplasma sp. AldY-WA1]|uniref:hypothetical protein n=1 Tax=Candidatus Phytoplasma sp. AldY-WA1 TaxID=2852100 RepID=UPI00254FEE4F|nr:hypothetical protein [Candidatus Phytoplasma sp. AldY-WA1]